MSNACLVTLLPRVQESLQGANKDGSVFLDAVWQDDFTAFEFSHQADSLQVSPVNYSEFNMERGKVRKHSYNPCLRCFAERKKQTRSVGVPPVTPTSPAASWITGAQRSTK